MVYRLQDSDKRFVNYGQNTGAAKEQLYRDREFTTIYRGVHMHVGGTSTTLFFTDENLTYERHPYNVCLSKTTHVLSN